MHALLLVAMPLIFDCPRVIDIEQTTLVADKTWELVQDADLPPASLTTVAVYTQHPSDGGNLAPDHSEKTADTEITSWRLPPDFAPYWAACVYIHSRILLAKRIPAEARQCHLTEALRANKPNGVLSFVCE
ncbi:hypothetical protein GTP46_26575 [Duganella sp. FT135W]|uniref:Uncharacterized protein n=1 Tax=Duganella flavida TaxID=2692175 RepID=A0A6L8KFG5_9BURK|nr:STY0301 family protein [Duganella flavida]MYM26199.1 hypothetical protein [Duganella flavida]